MGLLGPSVGRWFDRFGSRPLVVPGAVGIMVALGTADHRLRDHAGRRWSWSRTCC